jgi:hypothetical protein
MGLFESDLTVEHDNRGKIGIASVRPFESAGMPCLCAGGGFEGSMAADGAHIEMIEQSVFHWII